MAACELPPRPVQARSVLAMLRDIITDRGWPPRVVSRQDGYMFTADPDELERYEVAKVREKFTEVRRLFIGTVAPHARLARDDRRVRHIVTQLNSVESTLGLILILIA